MLYFGLWEDQHTAPFLIWCHNFCICYEISISEVVPKNLITHIFKSIDCILKVCFILLYFLFFPVECYDFAFVKDVKDGWVVCYNEPAAAIAQFCDLPPGQLHRPPMAIGHLLEAFVPTTYILCSWTLYLREDVT